MLKRFIVTVAGFALCVPMLFSAPAVALAACQPCPSGSTMTSQSSPTQGTCTDSEGTITGRVTCTDDTPSFLGDGSGSTGTSTSTVGLINPLGTTDPRKIIGNLIQAILSIIGSIALLMFIYGGVIWITSMGNDKLVQKGKQILVWTVVGLAVIAGAYTLTNAVISGLTTGQVTGG